MTAQTSITNPETAAMENIPEFESEFDRLQWHRDRIEAAQGLAWQPIATAPRDGTDVLLWCPGEPAMHDGICAVGYFHRDLWWHRANLVAGTPTHWRKLPDPPSVGETPETAG